MTSSYIILLTSIVLASCSQILLKIAANKNYENFIRQYLNPYVITGYSITFISLMLTMISLRKLDYKVEPLLESLGFVFVMILSRIFFKEKITIRKVLGTLFILAGIFVFYI